MEGTGSELGGGLESFSQLSRVLLRFELKLEQSGSRGGGLLTSYPRGLSMGLALPSSPRSSQFPDLHVIFQHESLPNSSFDIGNSKLGESADCQNQRVCTPSCPSRGLPQNAANPHSPLGVLSPCYFPPGPSHPAAPWPSPDPCTQAGTSPGGIASGRQPFPLEVGLSTEGLCEISWALCCLLVAVSLLMSLMRTTWTMGVGSGRLGPELGRM